MISSPCVLLMCLAPKHSYFLKHFPLYSTGDYHLLVEIDMQTDIDVLCAYTTFKSISKSWKLSDVSDFWKALTLVFLFRNMAQQNTLSGRVHFSITAIFTLEANAI